MNKAEIEDLFAELGSVSVRRMFGGHGVYHQGLIIAVEVDGEILLKADEETAPLFEAAGAQRWAYAGKKDKPISMPYWSVPDDAVDDPEDFARWARLAFEASMRAAKT